MEVGDSILGAKTARAAASMFGSRSGKTFTCREEGNGLRIWRTE